MARRRDKRPLIFVAVIATLFLLKTLFFKKTSQIAVDPKHQASVDQQESVSRKKPRRVASAVFILLTIVSGVAGWLLFSAARSGLPVRPSFQSGGILVFVDHANEQADIIVNFDRSGAFSVSVLSNSGGKFLVVASGSAEVYPAGTRVTDASDFISGLAIKSVEDSGCQEDDNPCIAYSGEDPAADFATSEHDLYDLNGYSAATVTVAAGDVDFGDTDSVDQVLTVYGKLSNGIVASSGSTELGQLPLIGASDSMSMRTGGLSRPGSTRLCHFCR